MFVSAATTWLAEDEADCPDLDAIEADLRTLATFVDSGTMTPAAISKALTDLAEAVGMWNEAIG